jgi:hypothetical protein
MLNSLNHLHSATVTATDGLIGHVKSAFFDDQSWVIRYLVVDAGTWLADRKVLISPYAVKQPLGADKNIEVSLTREQVSQSPDIDTHQPVSRQHEREYLGYYAYPEYWYGGGMWGAGGYPMLPIYLPTSEETEAAKATRERDIEAADVHLRSSARVSGYDIEATDGSIGHVKDFIFDDASWAIRYLVIDTRNWWPGGRKVLIATHWIERIDWAARSVEVKLAREQVRNSPAYQERIPVERDYEQRLHAAYQRAGYWD